MDQSGEQPETETIRSTWVMTSPQEVETSVNVITYSPSQDYTHPDDHTSPIYDMTSRFKPFTTKFLISYKKKHETEQKFDAILDHQKK